MEQPSEPARRSGARTAAALAAGAALLVAAICVVLVWDRASPAQLLEDGGSAAIADDVAAVVRLTNRRQAYEEAKKRVSVLHAKFENLENELATEVKDLDTKRVNLVDEMQRVNPDITIKSSKGIVVGAGGRGFIGGAFGTQARNVVGGGNVNWVGAEKGTVVAAAATAKDAADAAAEYLKQAAALEKAAEGSVSRTRSMEDAAKRLAKKAKTSAKSIEFVRKGSEVARNVMRRAIEESTEMAKYQAQAVDQASGGAKYISEAAKAVRGYVHSLFTAESKASLANDNIEREEAQAKEALARLQGEEVQARNTVAAEEAQMQRDEAIVRSYVNEVEYAAERAYSYRGVPYEYPAREYRTAREYPLQPYDLGTYSAGRAANWGRASGGLGLGATPLIGGEGETPLADAKELVDDVVVLMQQLTRALETSYADCPRVESLLEYYRGHMARYRVEGANVAKGLSPGDVGLVQKYAQVQVASFASNLESAVEAASRTCGVQPSAFLPDVPDIAEAAPSVYGGGFLPYGAGVPLREYDYDSARVPLGGYYDPYRLPLSGMLKQQGDATAQGLAAGPERGGRSLAADPLQTAAYPQGLASGPFASAVGTSDPQQAMATDPAGLATGPLRQASSTSGSQGGLGLAAGLLSSLTNPLAGIFQQK